jgi:hypothetical protein
MEMTDQATQAATATDDTAASSPQTSPPGGTEGQTNVGATPTEGQQATGEGGATEGAPATEGQQATETEIQDFTMPEGVTLDVELTGELKAFAKEHGLKQEAAQKVADLGAKLLQKQQDAFVEVRNQWAEQAKTDKEYGGEKFNENLAAANQALGQFATPEFVKFLQESGLGNHPEMLRTWHRISKAVSEDKLVTGNAASPDANTPQEKRLFPDMN